MKKKNFINDIMNLIKYYSPNLILYRKQQI